MKKRLLAAIMSLCMIVSLLPVSALAVETRQLPSSDTITVGETKNYTGTVGDKGHSWASSNEDIASVESGGWLWDDEDVSVTGHRPGTVTITHTYEEWVELPIFGYYEERKESFELTVQRDSTPGTHTAYFYVVNPETAQEPYTGREDEYFNYLGAGTVNNVPAADAEGYRGGEFWIGRDEETGNWTNTPPESPINITYNGTSYEYWDNEGTPPEHYYTVTWYRYSSSSGYVDENGTEHNSDTMCWHVDGYVDLNDMVFPMLTRTGTRVMIEISGMLRKIPCSVVLRILPIWTPRHRKVTSLGAGTRIKPVLIQWMKILSLTRT